MSSAARKLVKPMLCLSRRIGESETINIRIRYDRCPALIKLLELHGINPSIMAGLSDMISVEPLKMITIKGQHQVVIGVRAENHIQIVRNEIDRP